MVVDSFLGAECTTIAPIAQPRIEFQLAALILRWYMIGPWCRGDVGTCTELLWQRVEIAADRGLVRLMQRTLHAHRLMWPEPTLDRRRWLRIDQVKC